MPRKPCNSGITGGLTKAFMGKDFVNDDEQQHEPRPSQSLERIQQQQWLAQTGGRLDADCGSRHGAG